MKIGILNMQYSDHNYGAVLQAAALANTVEKMGCEVEHINFILQVSPSLRQRLAIGKRLRKLKKYLLQLFNTSYAKTPKTRQIQFTGQEIFEEFRLKWLKRSPKTFLSPKELHEYKFDYDAVIVGSDQIWRWIYLNRNIYSFFLDFISAPTKKIAYAASFGLDYFELDKNNPEIQKIKVLLNQFSAVSVRETSGVKICKETFGVSVVQVIDPTLLAGVEFFNRIIESENLPAAENKTDIVCCMLGSSKLSQELLSEFKSKNYSTGIIYPVKEIEKSRHFISVASWLKKIREAKFVITDSFHCVCMSILFEKDFVCIANINGGLARLSDLLGDVGLKNRIVTDNDNISRVMELFNESIQYDKTKKYFGQKREDALKFLRESLFENNEKQY